MNVRHGAHLEPLDRRARTLMFVEEIASVFEREGLPRMYGRILGHLMVCSPPHQSSAELCEALSASKGAISQATRALMQAELIQRKPMPGSRATYFEMRPGTMDHLLHASIARIRSGRDVMERGLQLLADRPPAERRRVEELFEVYEFMLREYPLLLKRWDEDRRARTARNPLEST